MGTVAPAGDDRMRRGTETVPPSHNIVIKGLRSTDKVKVLPMFLISYCGCLISHFSHFPLPVAHFLLLFITFSLPVTRFPIFSSARYAAQYFLFRHLDSFTQNIRMDDHVLLQYDKPDL